MSEKKLSDNRKIAILGMSMLMIGILLGVLLEYNRNLGREAQTIHKLNMISACNLGCYYCLNGILYEGETVEEDFPLTYANCRKSCQEQYG